MSYQEIVAALDRLGLWPVDLGETEHPTREDAGWQVGWPPDLLEFDKQLKQAEHGPVDRYLANRGLDLRDLNDIGYHPKAYHAWTNTSWPCMVAAVRDIDGRFRSLHRTWLSNTDPPVKAPIDPPRAVWGGVPVKGCAIRLAPAAPVMVTGEGIETTAAAMIQFGLPGWSAMTAGNLQHLKLPPLVKEVIVAADYDGPGLKGATAAAQRFRREGRRVRMIRPTTLGEDFNNLLLRSADDG